MLCEVRSLGLSGVSGYEVRAECDLSGGLPAFEIVGLPDAAVKEARDRVRAAVKNCGFAFPVSRITVNLAPADRKKGGTMYDLPILVGILAAGGQLKPPDPYSAFVGELSLSGRLRPVPGMLPMALAAREAGVKRLYVPAPSAAEATLAGGLEVFWSTFMKLSEGFTRPLYTVLTLIGLVLSFLFLSQATRVLPLGTAYAIWTGIGAVGAVVVGIVIFREPVTALRMVFVVLLLTGIIGLKATSGH